MIQLNLDDIESVLDRANDDADRVSVYEYRESLNAARAEISRREREHEALVETAQKALENVAAERDEARAEVERMRAERDHERMVANEQLARAHDAVRERDGARAEVERLRREREALVETTQRVCVHLSAELDDARAEVERLRSAYARHGAAGVVSVLAEIGTRT